MGYVFFRFKHQDAPAPLISNQSYKTKGEKNYWTSDHVIIQSTSQCKSLEGFNNSDNKKNDNEKINCLSARILHQNPYAILVSEI